MPDLKNLRIRIKSIQSTKKITSAMKMISVAKLRKSQKNALLFRSYHSNIQDMINQSLAEPSRITEDNILLTGHKKEKNYLVILCTSTRGLCGNFNTTIVKQTTNYIEKLLHNHKSVRVLILGKKGKSLFDAKYHHLIINKHFEVNNLNLDTSKNISDYIIRKFNHGVYDNCSIIYNYFHSALKQEPIAKQIIPYHSSNKNEQNYNNNIYLYEPSANELLQSLLLYNIHTCVHHALQESYASEQGARMSSMDSATRNAEDLISRLTVNYNRIRQSCITSELTEIISGAEALK